jgi:CheY-like chemotaxis protein/HPt (histidine-containing phosphotransfer) domain-containing protein
VRTAFADDAPTRERRIREALVELQTISEDTVGSTLEALDFEAHSIRGAAATAGLRDTAALAAELERAIARFDPKSPHPRDAITAAAERLLASMNLLAPGEGSGHVRDTAGSVEPDRPVVLHVEDNLSNLKLVERILARRPEIELREVRTGAEALELAATLRPSLVLLDLRLPDMSGEDVLQGLRDASATRDTPVVVVSAEARPAEADRLLAAGADEFLVKPIDVAVFLEMVDRMLTRRRR